MLSGTTVDSGGSATSSPSSAAPPRSWRRSSAAVSGCGSYQAFYEVCDPNT